MADARPDMILITTDQQRFDTFGRCKPSFLRTPHLDHLAQDDVTFSHAYSDCPVCVPSRVSIMSGKLARTHGCLQNYPSSRFLGHGDTLPAVLRDLGYQTAAIGKMHFGPARCRHGFDEMIISNDYHWEMDPNGSPLKPMQHGIGQNELWPGMATVPEAMTFTAWTANQCVHSIRERRDPTVPFFLWCSFSKPHPPLDPPEPYYSMYRRSDIPERMRSDWSDDARCPECIKRLRQRGSEDLMPPEIIREVRAAYYGLITQIDYNMGRVFSALQDLDLLREALILYTSDHGEFLGDHGLTGKYWFHEASARLPFILRFPKSWKSRPYGTENESLVTLADVLPTLAAAAGGRAPAGSDGVNLLDILEGCHYDPNQDTMDYAAITDGRHKYIWYFEGPSEQLFDLEVDPHELHNAADDPAYASMKQALQAELVAREKARGGAHLAGGKLASRRPRGDTEHERRADPWPGYHTEYCEKDVKH